MTNYNLIADNYAVTRSAQKYIGIGLIQELLLDFPYKILDFGCGTGNYINFLTQFPNWKLYGIDASERMLHYAKQRNPSALFKLGSERNIPYENNLFDYIYMVDVIHHIDSLNQLFQEFSRVSTCGALLCICTENEAQRKNKFWYQYFPSAYEVDTKRFYTENEIIEFAQNNNYTVKYVQESNIIECHSIPTNLIEEIRKRSISILHEITQDEYNVGLKKINQDYENKKIIQHMRGHSFIWFQKN